MEKFAEMKIKEMITLHPEVGKILEAHDIRCLRCQGNCLFKEVVEAENLSMEQEMEIMEQISALLNQGENVQ